MRAYQNAVAGEMARFEGHVAKFMGDGVLAYFGWPAGARGRRRARRPGRARGRRPAVGPADRSAGEPLAARVGIATGLVVVGDLIGEGAAREEAVVGETPNLAARLQALAEPGTVVIAERTRQLVGGLFELADLGRAGAQGVRRAGAGLARLGEGHAEGRFEALRGAALNPLVGREQELALLLDRWARARDGEGQVVLLSGEPGIGKSRLVRALRERLADEPHIAARATSARRTTRAARSGRWPSSSSARPASAADDPPAANLDRLEALLGQATADVGDGRAARRRAAGPARRRALPAAGPEPAAAQGEDASRSCWTSSPALRGGGRCSLLLEDAHWIDPSTQELFDLAVERLRELPVLLLVTFRPEYRCPWAGRGHVTALSLGRLGRQQAAALAGRLAGERDLPERARGADRGQSRRRAAVHRGADQGGAGGRPRAGPGRPRSLAIPSTLHDSLDGPPRPAGAA